MKPIMLRILPRLAILTHAVLFLFHCQRPAKLEPVHPDMGALPYPNLSDYRFFTGTLKDLTPNERVVPYELITPLFTDYAHKARFIWMPQGVQAKMTAAGSLDFPDQTILIKNFYYPADFRKPADRHDMVETRLLVRDAGVWNAYTYIWNTDDTDATYAPVGDILPVAWKDQNGLAQSVDYIVPNKNQCKSCHNIDNRFQPIGPKARNMNTTITYPDGTQQNQLAYLQAQGYLEAGDYQKQFPAVADWDDPHSGDLNARALAYLDINCAHCHNPHGPAHTTGLYLTVSQQNPALLGVHKPPVAAGKGSGNRHFGIVPGQPEGSILVYRMQSNDPGEMMPELGRALEHKEGVALIKDWIAAMPAAGFDKSNK